MPETNMPYLDCEMANRLVMEMKKAIDAAQILIFRQWLVISKQEKVIEALKREQRTELLAEVEG